MGSNRGLGNVGQANDGPGAPAGDAPVGADSYAIKLHLPGILTMLSEHLYSDPKVALRELLQNAYDSCQRRLVEHPEAGYKPCITIHIDPTQRTLTLSDNGSGLTPSEIHDYLSTIGRSYTSVLRDRLAFADHERQYALIGQFGLGILAAFAAAHKVELVTRSVEGADEEAWRWASAGEDSYTLTPASRKTIGTTVVLHVKPEGEFLLNEYLVQDAVRLYADFLDVPVYLNQGSAPVNTMHAPWHRESGQEDYLRYVADRFDVAAPLTVIPLKDHVERITLPDGRQESIVTPLAGVLFVPTGSILSIREYGEVAVYVRRMLITDQERELLPVWAKFVSGVVESPALNPTASREQVQRDETFFRIQHAIEAQLIAHFRHLAAERLDAWKMLALIHNDLIKAWALENQTLFTAICDLVTFDTNLGRLSLKDYLPLSGGTIYYFTDTNGAVQEQVLYEARDLPVINASQYVEESFLQAYAHSHPDVELRQLEPGALFVFEDVVEGLGQWQAVADYYAEQGIPVRVARYKPESIPAILVFPPGSEDLARTRALIQSGELSGKVADLVESFYKTRLPDQGADHGMLHLNAANLLMQHLKTLPPESDLFTAALEIVYHNARFFGQQMLSAEQARLSFDMISFSLHQLIKAVEDEGG
jgi:molecular chaperone HtpG